MYVLLIYMYVLLRVYVLLITKIMDSSLLGTDDVYERRVRQHSTEIRSLSSGVELPLILDVDVVVKILIGYGCCQLVLS